MCIQAMPRGIFMHLGDPPRLLNASATHLGASFLVQVRVLQRMSSALSPPTHTYSS
jgi:hypothetical protein